MTRVAKTKIHDELPDDVLAALADACDLHLSYDHAPGTDEWTLSGSLPAGPVNMAVEYVGTRRSVCAFLMGYSTMQLQTRQILHEIDRANRDRILDMLRTRLGVKS